MGKGHCDHLKWRIWPHKIVAALVSSVFFFTPLFLTFLLLAFCCRGSAEGRQTADGHPLSADDGDGLYDDDDPSAERAVEDKSREDYDRTMDEVIDAEFGGGGCPCRKRNNNNNVASSHKRRRRRKRDVVQFEEAPPEKKDNNENQSSGRSISAESAAPLFKNGSDSSSSTDESDDADDSEEVQLQQLH